MDILNLPYSQQSLKDFFAQRSGKLISGSRSLSKKRDKPHGKKRWKPQKLRNISHRYSDLSDKLAYFLHKKHNKRFYSIEALCAAPPKYMIWLLSTGDVEIDKKYEPVKSPLCFDLFLQSIKSQI